MNLPAKLVGSVNLLNGKNYYEIEDAKNYALITIKLRTSILGIEMVAYLKFCIKKGGLKN